MTQAVVVDEKMAVSNAQAFASSKVANSYLKGLMGTTEAMRSVVGFMGSVDNPKDAAWSRLESLLIERRGRRDEKHSHVTRASKEVIAAATEFWNNYITLYEGLENLDPDISTIVVRTDSWGRNPRMTAYRELPPDDYYWYYDYNGNRRDATTDDHREWPIPTRVENNVNQMPSWFMKPTTKAKEVVVWYDVADLKALTTSLELFQAKQVYLTSLYQFGSLDMDSTNPDSIYAYRKQKYLVDGGDFDHSQWTEILDMWDELQDKGYVHDVEGYVGSVKMIEGYWYYQPNKHTRWGRYAEERGAYAYIPLGIPWTEATPELSTTIRLQELAMLHNQAKTLDAEVKAMKKEIPVIELEYNDTLNKIIEIQDQMDKEGMDYP